MDFTDLVVVHPELGQLALERTCRSTTVSITFRARGPSGEQLEVTLGRAKAQPTEGGIAAYSTRGGDGGPVFRRSLTRAVIDGALIVQSERYREDGESYHVTCHGLGEWVDPETSRSRPALVTDQIEGETLVRLDPLGWREEAWQILSSLLVMVMVTPAGEKAPHRDVKASNIVMGDDNRLHLLSPGVELVRSEVAALSDHDLTDDEDEEPWDEEERVTLTTFSAYPILPPGTPGADLMAMGLMVYEGLTGRRPFDSESPAPRSYNFGIGAHGRGVPSPQILVGQIPPVRTVLPAVAPEMEIVVSELLHAPLGHELPLGVGRGLRDWAALCHEAAESVR